MTDKGLPWAHNSKVQYEDTGGNQNWCTTFQTEDVIENIDFTPFTDAVTNPLPPGVSLGGLCSPNFTMQNYLIPTAGDNSHVGIGALQILVTTGGSATSPAHTVGQLGWNIGNINAGQTQTLIVGQEGKLDLVSGSYSIACAHLSNVDQILANVIVLSALYSYLAQIASIAESIALLTSYGTSFGSLAAGKNVTLWNIFSAQSPTAAGILGSIQNVAAFHMDPWTGVAVPGYFRAVDIQESRAAIYTQGPVQMPNLASGASYANDAAAAVGGVPVGQFYRNGSVVQIRVT